MQITTMYLICQLTEEPRHCKLQTCTYQANEEDPVVELTDSHDDDDGAEINGDE